MYVIEITVKGETKRMYYCGVIFTETAQRIVYHNDPLHESVVKNKYKSEANYMASLLPEYCKPTVKPYHVIHSASNRKRIN